MVFLGFLKVGKSLASLSDRVAATRQTVRDTREAIREAQEARRTVVAQIGEELTTLSDLEKSL